jgi:hypothetical protein
VISTRWYAEAGRDSDSANRNARVRRMTGLHEGHRPVPPIWCRQASGLHSGSLSRHPPAVNLTSR